MKTAAQAVQSRMLFNTSPLSRLMGEHKRIRLETDRTLYEDGEQVRLYAHVLDEDFEPVVQPSFAITVSGVNRKPVLVLLKPADAQFLVSTAKFAPWHVVDVAAGAGVIAWAFHRLGRVPGPLATSTCSHHVSRELFVAMLREAHAGRSMLS